MQTTSDLVPCPAAMLTMSSPHASLARSRCSCCQESRWSCAGLRARRCPQTGSGPVFEGLTHTYGAIGAVQRCKRIQELNAERLPQKAKPDFVLANRSLPVTRHALNIRWPEPDEHLVADNGGMAVQHPTNARRN